MAVLAGLLGGVVAMLPLLVGNLLGEPRQLLTLRPKRRSDQRMAAPAKTRLAYMVAPGREVRRRRRMHYRLVAFVHLEGPILGPLVVLDRFREDHISDEGRLRSQPRLLNLMTNRAGDTICGGAVALGKLLQRKTRKHLRVFSRIPVRHPNGRHMADRAFVLDRLLRLRMIHRLAS